MNRVSALVLPTTQAGWQHQIDEWFPGQVNCRIQADASRGTGDFDDDIDFATAGLTVIGTERALPRVLFWSNDGASKDFYVRTVDLRVLQTQPCVLVAMRDDLGRDWLFWPRPGNEQSDSQKITERGMAMASAADYQDGSA